MSKEEFEEGYCVRSEITKEYYDKHMITLFCTCADDECDGWVAVSNNPLSIKAHKDLYQRGN